MGYPNNLPTPYPVNPQLTAIAIAYSNKAFIADLVFPRVLIPTPSFYYSIFNKVDFFTNVDDKVDRKSYVNQIDWASTQASATVDDHALDQVVPLRDQEIAAAYGGYIDPKPLAAQQVAEILALNRETRAAAMLFNPANYASTNVSTLTGTAQWSDKVNSDPLSYLIGIMDGMIIRPNQIVLGRQVATALQTHPKVIQAYNSDNGQFGLAPLSFLANLLGIDDVVIGEAWGNVQKKGQPGSLARIWGKSVALLYTNKTSVSTTMPSFGITAQFGGKYVVDFFDQRIGYRGSDIVRVAESVKEVVLANDLGFLIQNAVA